MKSSAPYFHSGVDSRWGSRQTSTPEVSEQHDVSARGEMKAETREGGSRSQSRGFFRLRRIPLGVIIILLFAGCASSGSLYEGMGADDLWAAGVEAFEEEDWSKAIELFDMMIQTNAAHPSVPDARLYMARAHEAQEEYILAIGEYQIFLDTYFSNARAPEASLGICRSYVALSPIAQRDQADTRRARDACGRTAIEFQGLTVAEEAEALEKQMVERLGEKAFQIAEHYVRQDLLLSALDPLEAVVTEYWDTSWAPKALLARHRVYLEMEWAEEAEEEALRLEYNYPESPEAAELRAERAAAVPPTEPVP